MPTPGTVPLVAITAGVPNTGTGNVSTLDNVFNVTNGRGTFKAASTPPVAADEALVVAISPNGVNVNLSDGSAQTSAGHTGAPVVGIDPYSQYKLAPVSATTVMGATGARYDYLAGVLVIPSTAAAGTVDIQDGNATAIRVFVGGGTTALADLKPFLVPLGLHALVATTPGWRIINGANVTAIGIGSFT